MQSLDCLIPLCGIRNDELPVLCVLASLRGFLLLNSSFGTTPRWLSNHHRRHCNTIFRLNPKNLFYLNLQPRRMAMHANPFQALLIKAGRQPECFQGFLFARMDKTRRDIH